MCIILFSPPHLPVAPLTGYLCGWEWECCRALSSDGWYSFIGSEQIHVTNNAEK